MIFKYDANYDMYILLYEQHSEGGFGLGGTKISRRNYH